VLGAVVAAHVFCVSGAAVLAAALQQQLYVVLCVDALCLSGGLCCGDSSLLAADMVWVVLAARNDGVRLAAHSCCRAVVQLGRACRFAGAEQCRCCRGFLAC
jgi:hypothetical protein